MVVSVIALVVAMSGTGYAAVSLPKNSVGAKQLKRKAVTNSKLASNAVTGAKVKADTLTGSDILESSLGKVPAAGAADSATNATNATNAVHAASADSAPVPTVLGKGQTLHGAYALRAGTNGEDADGISFDIPLSAAPTVHVIRIGQATPAGCSGDASNPGADSGNLCIFEGWNFNTGNLQTCNLLSSGGCVSNQATRFGTGVLGGQAVAGLWDDFGTWAVTG